MAGLFPIPGWSRRKRRRKDFPWGFSKKSTSSNFPRRPSGEKAGSWLLPISGKEPGRRRSRSTSCATNRRLPTELWSICSSSSYCGEKERGITGLAWAWRLCVPSWRTFLQFSGFASLQGEVRSGLGASLPGFSRRSDTARHFQQFSFSHFGGHHWGLRQVSEPSWNMAQTSQARLAEKLLTQGRFSYLAEKRS